MATTAAGVLSMKLLIDTKSQRVVFAEGGKDVVDFLYSLLALPLGTAVALIRDCRSMAGSVANLYASVQSLDDSYFLPGADRVDLLRPTVVRSRSPSASTSLLLPPPPPKTFFVCHRSCGGYTYRVARRYVTDVRSTACPNCSQPMTDPHHYISTPSSVAGRSASGGSSPVSRPSTTAKGFVQGVVTYTIKDDLTVTPMSTVSTITLLNTFSVTDIGDLQEKTVYLGNREGLEILKASLQSKTVLTDVFLRNNSSGTA